MDDFERRATERIDELGDDIDQATFAAMFDLFRVSSRLISDLESKVHRPLGLSIAGFRILFTVWVFDSLEPRELARLAGVSTAAVSGVVTTLERNGLVEKSRHDDDRRLVSVRPTVRGRDLLSDAYRAQNAREQELFAELSADELEVFVSLLRKVLNTRS